MPNEVVIKDVDGNKVGIDGDRLKVDAQLEVTDIEIGAVEIKDSDSDNRVIVDGSGNLQTEVNNVVDVDATGQGDVPVTLDDEQVETKELNQLVPEEYDYISLSYTNDDLTGVVYKTGGVGGDTVATLTLTYSNSILQTITRT